MVVCLLRRRISLLGVQDRILTKFVATSSFQATALVEACYSADPGDFKTRVGLHFGQLSLMSI